MSDATQQPIVIVSGLPRSGTSLMMQMLEAGGIPIVSDGERVADTDNPRGYYELEAVKKLPQETSWMPEAPGKAVKIISALLQHLPPQYRYQVIFMERKYAELLASQREMLKRRGTDSGGPDDAAMQKFFEEHVTKVRQWLDQQPNFEVLTCSYNGLLQEPEKAVQEITSFLKVPVDAGAMGKVIDRGLYRNQAAGAKT